eukprot:618912-Alexandrium_andersonii.AAC.1
MTDCLTRTHRRRRHRTGHQRIAAGSWGHPRLLERHRAALLAPRAPLRAPEAVPSPELYGI